MELPAFAPAIPGVRAKVVQSEPRSRISAHGAEKRRFSRKEIRMLLRSLLKIFLFATILLVTVIAASAAAPTDQATDNSVGSIHTYLTPDLSLKSSFLVPLAGFPQGPHRKTCHCSCGSAPCNSDADCGGAVGSCSAFISCCAKSGGAQWMSDQASRKNELPAFKESCN